MHYIVGYDGAVLDVGPAEIYLKQKKISPFYGNI